MFRPLARLILFLSDHLLLVAILWVLILVLTQKPIPGGDSGEYLLTQISFANHASFEIRAEDLVEFESRMKHQGEAGWLAWLHGTLIPGMEARKNFAGGYVPDLSGNYIATHFWLYSVLSLPFVELANTVGMNVFVGFTVLNAICLVCGIGFLKTSPSFRPFEKVGILLGFLSLHSVFYFNWSHPEVLSSSGLFVAFLLVTDRKWVSAMVAVAIAGLQNQPIIAAVPILWVGASLSNYGDRRSLWSLGLPFRNFAQWFGVLLAGLITLTPSLYFNLAYGTPNPIAAIEGVALAYASWQRFVSVWFDLNQGVWLGYLGWMITACFLGILTFKTLTNNRTVLLTLGVVFLCLVSMTLPCLIQGNWNAGSSTMLRYGIWLGVGLIPSVFLLFRGVNPMGKWFFGCLLFGLQAMVFAASHVPAKTIVVQHHGLANWVLVSFPALYNPIPEIFAERTLGRELDMPQVDWVAYPETNNPTKLLTRFQPILNRTIWNENKRYVFEDLPAVRKTEKNWIYLNGRAHLETAEFYEVLPASDKVSWENGWGYPEGKYIWALDESSHLVIPPPKKGQLSGRMKLTVQPQGAGKKIAVLFNGHEVFSGFVSGKQNLLLAIDPSMVLQKGANEIVFRVVDPQSPAGGVDQRVLGLRFYRLIMELVEE